MQTSRESAVANPIMPKQQENQCNFDYFCKLTINLSNSSCNILAFYAAKLVQHLNPDQRVANCINLVEKWLKTPNLVKQAELREAATFIIYIGANNICWAAGSACWAAVYINNAIRAAWAIHYAIDADITVKDKLIAYINYLLPKNFKDLNFNHDLLKQNNSQAYSFLENISKLEDYEITDDDLFGIRQIFDVLEEVGVPLDPNEFKWEGENSVYNEVTEKHRLLQTIRREF